MFSLSLWAWGGSAAGRRRVAQRYVRTARGVKHITIMKFTVLCVTLLAILALASGKLVNFVLVDARNRKHLGYIYNGRKISSERYYVVKAIVSNQKQTRWVAFYVNGRKVFTDYAPPFFIQGNPKRINNWIKPIGTVTIRAVEKISSGRNFYLKKRIIVTGTSQPTKGSDPQCKTGVRSRKACCPKACKTCGGANCSRRAKGYLCCEGTIVRIKQSCTVSLPPCKLATTSRSPPPKSTPPAKPPSGPGKWKTISVRGQPTRRHEGCFVMAAGKGWLIGGRGRKPTDMYDPVRREWKRRRGPPIELHHMQCVATPDGKIWIVSAFTGPYPRERNTNKVYVYNTRTDGWTTYAGLPSNRLRGGGAAILSGDWIYVIAGNRGGHGAHSTAYSWMDRFNYKQKRWETNLPNAPSARDHVGGGKVKGMLCVAAGRDSGVAKFSNNVVRQTDCFDLRTNQWMVKANIPQGRAGAATATDCNGRLVVAGGEGFGRAFRNVDYFNGNSWGSTTYLQRGRHGTGLAVHSCNCRQISIASGSGGQGGGPELTSLETYLPGQVDRKCS